MVSSAKRNLERGSDALSRGFVAMEPPRNLVGKKDEKPDIAGAVYSYRAIVGNGLNDLETGSCETLSAAVAMRVQQ